MSWLDGLIRNWAELDPGASDPRLHPVDLAMPRDEAVRWAAGKIARMPRWKVMASDPESGTLHATHRTRVWRFVDDIRLRFEPRPDSGRTRVLGRSESRIGKGDLGQNARNLGELTRTLRTAAEEAHPT